jgi:hypothetical protein
MALTAAGTASPRVAEIFKGTNELTSVERLTLAKLLLESVLTDEPDEEAHWSALGLEAFQKDWDNAEDAVYDDWRKAYGVPTR